MMLESHLRPFFCDIDAATFEEGEIRRVVRSERRVSRKSATFWALVYGVPLDDGEALKRS